MRRAATFFPSFFMPLFAFHSLLPPNGMHRQMVQGEINIVQWKYDWLSNTRTRACHSLVDVNQPMQETSWFDSDKGNASNAAAAKECARKSVVSKKKATTMRCRWLPCPKQCHRTDLFVCVIELRKLIKTQFCDKWTRQFAFRIEFRPINSGNLRNNNSACHGQRNGNTAKSQKYLK